MSIFRTILDKIFHHSTSTASAATGQPSQASTPQTQAATATASAGQKLQAVDVEAVLSQLAAKKGGGGNWRTSIVWRKHGSALIATCSNLGVDWKSVVNVRLTRSTRNMS